MAGHPHPAVVFIRPIAGYPNVLGTGSDTDDLVARRRRFAADDYGAGRRDHRLANDNTSRVRVTASPQ